MFTVADNGIIVINRGDTFECPLVIAMSTSPDIVRYTLGPTDVLAFNIVYPGSDDDEAPALSHIYSEDGQEGHIQPEYNESGDLILRFSADEMQTLEAGTYYYEAVLTYSMLGPQRVDTIIPRTKMRIVE